MKTLYIECGMGAAGDMLMAALLELVEDKEDFLRKINGAGIDGVGISAETSFKHGIKGTHVSVIAGDGAEETSFDADLGDTEDICANTGKNAPPGLNDIEARLSRLQVSEKVKEDALAVYRLLAEAEAHVHGRPVTEIHFHEIGNLDAIADIVGVCLLLETLAPERVVVSPVHVGGGFVKCAHGVLPVPAPATARILRDVPTFGGKIKGELCTPTGAALLRRFACEFGPMPEMRVHKIGYGMGKKDFEAVNCVRAFWGEESAGAGGPNGHIAELRCNIDDMSGEALGFACQTLMNAGARDVFTTPIGMKKGRPGVLLTCVCDASRADMFAGLILRHTTTFGVRKAVLSRYTLEREILTRQTPFGAVRAKTGKGYGVEKAKLEYEDVAASARERNISTAEMERLIWAFLDEQGEQI